MMGATRMTIIDRLRENARILRISGGFPTIADECDEAANAILAERERCAKIIEDNMLVGDGNEESIIPRTNPGNKVGLAYAAAIRNGGCVKKPPVHRCRACGLPLGVNDVACESCEQVQE
jgi:hypothetical protein